MITYEWVRRYDGKYNVWRQSTGPWLLVHVCTTEQEAIDFCAQKN
jgi:hypothetical protein